MKSVARQAGFTLLEILLALALLAFVMLGVWGAMRGAARVTRSADAVMAQSEAVRTVQQF
ncbi:MAG: prepilin-type N-terminal cleavage/methylation domain-containing protein, partial [Xanthomonadaceae bacterium]|nr:prepilin-type N-terminal cleavage/methylation domain-containing protein [Xanthomonadaceae bacterium]